MAEKIEFELAVEFHGVSPALIFYQECRPLSDRSSSTRAPVIFGDSLVSSQFPLSIVRTLLSISVCFREQTTLLSGSICSETSAASVRTQDIGNWICFERTSRIRAP